MSTVIYIGPSVGNDRPAELDSPDFVVRPPVRRGDLDQLDPEVRRVAIVDGVFHSSQAVAPREILAVLRRGIEVWGSSSMGALRAAELSTFGMHGVGEVYRQYAEGEITSDADVALAFDPETGVALTEPMVNVRQMVALAREAGILSRRQAQIVLDVANELHYPQRTYPMIEFVCAGRLSASVMTRWRAHVVGQRSAADLKRSDALALIAALTGMEPAPTEDETMESEITI